MANRVLLKGGHVVTMDPSLGDLSPGDVLIDGDSIARVAPNIDAGDAEVIDASGDIVIIGVDLNRALNLIETSRDNPLARLVERGAAAAGA